MPDRDAILRGLQGLVEIQTPNILDARTAPKESYRGNEHEAEFWATNEGYPWAASRHYVLRTQGDMRGRALIERDFQTVLGEPVFRSEEGGLPKTDSTYWRADKVTSILSQPNRRPTR